MSGDPRERLAAALDGDPSAYRWFRAPGRVNLIGDHTDYNDGFVLPMAIQLECVVAARVREDERLELRSLDDLDARPYVDAVAEALGTRVGLEGALASSVPAGSGLSSSAALEVAVALALAGTAGLQPSATELALACQRAEHVATGVPSGIMDQLASAAGVAGHALLIDCRSLVVTPVPVPPQLAVLVVHSGVARTLAGSEYGDRRRECERIARELGVAALRDATLDQVLDEPLARHVVSENHRVHAAADALRQGDLAGLGRLFLESHASLRDDYRVSTPELDALVDALVGAGAAGARLTGAGFGGCAVAVAARERAGAVLEEGAAAYAERTGRSPTVWLCEPSPGAARLEPRP